MLSLHISSGEWSSQNITGQPPSPFSLFTLTQVGERRAALFGGWSGSGTLSDLFVVELSRHTVVSVVRKHYCYGVFLVSKSHTETKLMRSVAKLMRSVDANL